MKVSHLVRACVVLAAVAFLCDTAAAQRGAAKPKGDKPLVEAIGTTDPGPLPPGGPAPRMADGKPDFSGIWFSGNIGRPSAWSRTPPERIVEDPVPFNAEATAKIKSMTRAQLQAADPTVNCLPRGVPGMFTMNPHPSEIVTIPGSFIQLVEAGNVWRYDVASDGQRFLVVSPLGEETPSPIHLVVNWTAELKKP